MSTCVFTGKLDRRAERTYFLIFKKGSPFMNESDYYELLQVAENADQQQIKESYRKLAFQYHPDRNQDPESTVKMKAVNEAYAVLSNPEKRREYDTMRSRYGSNACSHFKNRHSQEDIFRGSDINHVFEEMARNFGFRNFNDIFKEVYGQGSMNFESQRPGFVSRSFVFTGRPGGQANSGRLLRYVLKKMTGVELPENGKDIHEKIRLNHIQARNGGQHPYILKQRSAKLLVQVPPGVREGQTIRLAGMGQAGKGGGKAGDLFLKVIINTPLTDRIGALFLKIKKACMQVWTGINS